MAGIKELYIDLLGSMYPYEELPTNETESNMLYNLICISQNNFAFPIEDDDIQEDYNKIMALIDLFVKSGIEPSLY